MTADGYEWFSPCSPPRGHRLTAAIRCAEVEIERRKARDAVLGRGLRNDQPWMILLHVFVGAGSIISVDRLARDLGMKKPEVLRWLLALESQCLLVVVGRSDHVFLTASCQCKMVEYFVEPFLFTLLSRKWRVAVPRIRGLVADASMFLLSFSLLAGATAGPLLAPISAY